MFREFHVRHIHAGKFSETHLITIFITKFLHVGCIRFVSEIKGKNVSHAKYILVFLITRIRHNTKATAQAKPPILRATHQSASTPDQATKSSTTENSSCRLWKHRPRPRPTSVRYRMWAHSSPSLMITISALSRRCLQGPTHILAAWGRPRA